MTDLIEAWNKINPKTSRINTSRNKFNVNGKIKWGMFGNYKVRDYLMNTLQILEDKSIVIQIPKYNQQYFKILEKNVIENIKKMVSLL